MSLKKRELLEKQGEAPQNRHSILQFGIREASFLIA